MKPIILTFIGHYLPGHLAGGPIRSIANMVELLSDEFDFYIITSDHDCGASEPYQSVKLDQWNIVGNAQVFYVSNTTLSLRRLAKLVRETPYDLIYLNSFFDPIFTIRLLMAIRLGLIPLKPVIIAPRGEFSEGALALKSWKKKPYLLISKWLGLYNNVLWHASTVLEKKDILRVFKKNTEEVTIAIDLVTSKNSLVKNNKSILIAPNLVSISQSISQPVKILQVCFLSRICPKKNLDYALRVLADVKVPVCFSIYGPQEDHEYWSKCQVLIANLPAHIEVIYKGSVDHLQVINTLAQYELFFFPTQGENFGHVIYEALLAGIPVLLSDQTPWLDFEEKGVGWSLPLNSPSSFVSAIEEVAGWSAETQKTVSERVLVYAENAGNNTHSIKQNVTLFKKALRMI